MDDAVVCRENAGRTTSKSGPAHARTAHKSLLQKKDWKTISAESSIMSFQWPSQRTELSWICWTKLIMFWKKKKKSSCKLSGVSRVCFCLVLYRDVNNIIMHWDQNGWKRFKQVYFAVGLECLPISVSLTLQEREATKQPKKKKKKFVCINKMHNFPEFAVNDWFEW